MELKKFRSNRFSKLILTLFFSIILITLLNFLFSSFQTKKEDTVENQNNKSFSRLDSFLNKNLGFNLSLDEETERRIAIYCDPETLLKINKQGGINIICENPNPAHKIVIGTVDKNEKYLVAVQELGNQQLFWNNSNLKIQGAISCAEDQDYLKYRNVLFGVNCVMTLTNTNEKLYSSTVILQQSHLNSKIFISILNTTITTSAEKVKNELTALLENNTKSHQSLFIESITTKAYAEGSAGGGGDAMCSNTSASSNASAAACGNASTADNGGGADATVCDLNNPSDCYPIYCNSPTAYWDVLLLKCVEPPICSASQVQEITNRYRCHYPQYTYGKEDTVVYEAWGPWQATTPTCGSLPYPYVADIQSIPTYTCHDLPTSPTLNASPSSIYEGSSSVITWGASSYADICTGSGGTFAGAKNIAGGSQSTGVLATAGSYQYTITCSNAYGSSAPVSTTVTVNTAYSDLTAAAATPSNAVPGTTNTLSAVISNIGLASTGGSFSNFFQVADQVGGGGTITDLPSVSMGALVAGANNTATKNYTFPNGPGTYSVRVCADKTSSAGGGVINEGANEGNNCGTPWTTVTVACTGTNRWDSVNGVCVDPQVVLAYITDQHYPPGDIHLSCNADTDSYSVFKGGALFIGPNQYTAPVILNDVVTESNSYVIKCIHGSVEDQIAVPYDANIPPAVVKLIATETTIDPPASTTIKWEVDYPTAACTLTAKVVCANDACTAAQLANEASINTILSTTNTDPNDPSTSRSMLSAIQSPAPGHKDSDTPIITADYKALGKKTIPVKYTTDITYNCNGTKETKRIRVIKSEEQ